MSELVSRAKDFATQAHSRIGHRTRSRKTPFDAHLKEVARLVAGASEEPEMVAAAWLHDVVNDTEATFHDVEREFGREVASLVRDLTEVSKPSDGDRAAQAAIDREQLARASARAKTVKLADLVAELGELRRHPPEDARVRLREVSNLLAVLRGGDQALEGRVRKQLNRACDHLGIERLPGTVMGWHEASRRRGVAFAERRLQRLFLEVFSARDIADSLPSFDSVRDAAEVARAMRSMQLEMAGIRSGGEVIGYLRREDLGEGRCSAFSRSFGRDQVVDGEASLSEVILVLTRYDHCFVSILEGVSGVITRGHIDKPIVRMWLFGMITIVEMDLTARLRQRWPGDGWRKLCTPARLKKAEQLAEERARREQQVDVIDCLQLSDKARILLKDPETFSEFGFESKGQADRVVRDLESLRNNLAHAQAISLHDWPQIVRMTQSLQAG